MLFIIVLQAELEKDPFDIPHAETEIVGGYETEYSGRKLAFIKLAEDFQFLIGASLGNYAVLRWRTRTYLLWST